jgi:hypothetical protein
MFQLSLMSNKLLVIALYAIVAINASSLSTSHSNGLLTYTFVGSADSNTTGFALIDDTVYTVTAQLISLSNALMFVLWHSNNQKPNRVYIQ